MSDYSPVTVSQAVLAVLNGSPLVANLLRPVHAGGAELSYLTL